MDTFFPGSASYSYCHLWFFHNAQTIILSLLDLHCPPFTFLSNIILHLFCQLSLLISCFSQCPVSPCVYPPFFSSATICIAPFFPTYSTFYHYFQDYVSRVLPYSWSPIKQIHWESSSAKTVFQEMLLHCLLVWCHCWRCSVPYVLCIETDSIFLLNKYQINNAFHIHFCSLNSVTGQERHPDLLFTRIWEGKHKPHNFFLVKKLTGHVGFRG